MLPSAGTAEHGEPAGSPTSPTAHWAAHTGSSAEQQDFDEGDGTDDDYVDAAESAGSPASPTAHWAQPHGAAGQQVEKEDATDEEHIERRDSLGRPVYDYEIYNVDDDNMFAADYSDHEGAWHSSYLSAHS